MSEEVFGKEELNRPIDSERLRNLFSKEDKKKMTKEELKQKIEDNHNHFKEVAENYVNESWSSFIDLSEVDLVMAGIGVGKIIALEEEKQIAELKKENAELKDANKNLQEFYEKEYFEISDRTADEKIKELEKYQTEVTVDDYSPYDPNTWGMMHEEMFVPKELVRDLLKENYALSEHHKDQLTKAKEIIREFVEWANWQGNSKCPSFKSIQDKAEQFLKDSEVEK